MPEEAVSRHGFYMSPWPHCWCLCLSRYLPSLPNQQQIYSQYHSSLIQPASPVISLFSGCVCLQLPSPASTLGVYPSQYYWLPWDSPWSPSHPVIPYQLRQSEDYTGAQLHLDWLASPKPPNCFTDIKKQEGITSPPVLMSFMHACSRFCLW